MLRFNMFEEFKRWYEEQNFNTSYVTVQLVANANPSLCSMISIHPMLRFNAQ